MKLQEEQNEMEVEGDFVTQDMKIEISAHAFNVLSKGLYSDPHKAIVRELACNARDAQVETGLQDKPFDLYLPNALAPTFKIRDYGPGLPPEKIPTLYTYFKSTKQTSDEMTGCFGLGSKSPFAYTKKFTAISYHGGKRYHFVVFMNAKGIPATTLMSTEDSTEPSGLEVSFPVEYGEYHVFQSAAKKALIPFDVKPVIHGVDGKFWDDEEKPFLEGPGWKMYRSSYDYYGRRSGVAGPIARMGYVDYPIDGQNRSGISKHAKALLGSHVTIDFPLGAFEITPSRETIQWTDYSTENINARLEQVYDEIVKHATGVVQNAPSYWVACIKSQEYCRTQMLAHLNLRPTWNGKQIVEHIPIPKGYKILQIRATVPRRDNTATSMSASSSEFYGGIPPFNSPKFYFADYKGAIHRIETMVRTQYTAGDQCLLIVAQDEVDVPNVLHTNYVKTWGHDPVRLAANPHPATVKGLVNVYDAGRLQGIVDGLGILNSDVTLASNAPQLPRVHNPHRSRLAGSKARAFAFKPYIASEACDQYWDEAEVDLDSVTEGVYVEIRKWTLRTKVTQGIPRDSSNPERPHAMTTWFKKFELLGLKLPDPGLIGVKTADIKKFQDAKNWITIDQFAERELKKYWKANPSFHKSYQIAHYFDHQDYFNQLSYLWNRASSMIPTGPFRSMLEEVVHVTEERDKAFAFKRCSEGLWDDQWRLELTTGGKEAQALVNNATQRYPLLPILYENRNSRNVPNDEVINYSKLIDNQKGE